MTANSVAVIMNKEINNIKRGREENLFNSFQFSFSCAPVFFKLPGYFYSELFA